MDITDPTTKKPYYIDDIVFDDDTLLTAKRRAQVENRCGSGIVHLTLKDHLHIGERDIIPGPPANKTKFEAIAASNFTGDPGYFIRPFGFAQDRPFFLIKFREDT